MVKQNYSFKAAADAVGVSSRSLREWHEKRASERQPCDDDASVELLREENKQLKKRLQRAEMERDILKKPRFFWSLKHEWTKFETFADINQARTSVFQYIETFYNSKRIHQTLGYQTPDEFEAQHRTKLAV